jgi:hypothetical protein
VDVIDASAITRSRASVLYFETFQDTGEDVPEPADTEDDSEETEDNGDS